MTRTLDLVLAGIALIVLAPVLVLIALVVRLSSPGPALFSQTRVGHRGRPFQILKFRTMRHRNYDEPSGPLVTADGDSRITGIGRLLRASKLDELPQLINVMKGEMSLVGPRPEIARYAAHWTAAQRDIILSVRPGITDPASIRFRNESALLADQEDPEAFYVEHLIPLKAELYVAYVRGRSVRTDITLLFTTAASVIKR